MESRQKWNGTYFFVNKIMSFPIRMVPLWSKEFKIKLLYFANQLSISGWTMEDFALYVWKTLRSFRRIARSLMWAARAEMESLLVGKFITAFLLINFDVWVEEGENH